MREDIFYKGEEIDRYRGRLNGSEILVVAESRMTFECGRSRVCVCLSYCINICIFVGGDSPQSSISCFKLI